ncbi:MAG: thioredoxin domain-containing protein [Pseudomonadota bacterium]
MTAAPAGPRNRLAAETSPYLLQHAADPVDWYTWGPEALALARRLDRPILLSIGYSACHWCHVMAHESFADPATAAVMNALFVNVKVDREERPDLDRTYQLAHSVLVRHGGGWPLTMFLAPDDLAPFFGGTYFPAVARHGLPAFRELLERVADYWRDQREAIRVQNGELLEVFRALAPAPPADGLALDAAPLDRARERLLASFDAEWGGFSAAPKFPQPGFVERLLRHWHSTASADLPDLEALWAATLTLTRMAEGGLYDHVGGGFARYSTDRWWMIPHFEKMASDNGRLLALYADAAVATGEPLFRRAAEGTAGWLLGAMRGEHGAFATSLDADSEGEEGRYYAWDRAELERALAPNECAALSLRYGLDGTPNFERGRWHLHAHAPLAEVATALGTDEAGAASRIDAALARLAAARAARVPPGRDDKVLTAWNALVIRGLAVAARAFGRDDWERAATAALDALRERVWRDGRLYANWRDGRVGAAAFLDDHAFLLDALLALLQVRWRAADLEWAVSLADSLLERFEDREHGGFWFTAHDAEAVLRRSKTFADEALPSGNGVAAHALQRLGWLLGETRWLDAAERTLRAGWEPLTESHPHAHGALLAALEERLAPAEFVILRGPAHEVARWARELASLYAPRRVVLPVPDDATGLPPALASKHSHAGALAYVCKGSTCEPPVASLGRLVRRLRDGLMLAERDD